MTKIYFAEKLKSIKQTFYELTEHLTDPDTIVDAEELTKIATTRNFLAEIIELDYQLQQAKLELSSNRQILLDEDSELGELATEEIANLETKISRLTERLNILLLTYDPLDRNNVFLEVTANKNTDENCLWVLGLVKMYARYSDSQNWKVRFLSEDICYCEGFNRVVLSVESCGAYGKLKFETGIHQLVSDSHSVNGRIETTIKKATVNVIPQVAANTLKIYDADLKIYTDISSYEWKSVFKIPVGVKIVHQPTGIEVTCTEERSQLQNRERAMQILRAKLYDIKLTEQQKEVRGLRLSQVVTGSRSEKIRTYNYKDNRITDHRLGKNFPLAGSLEGDIDVVVQSCISQDRQDRLEELANSPHTAEGL